MYGSDTEMSLAMNFYPVAIVQHYGIHTNSCFDF